MSADGITANGLVSIIIICFNQGQYLDDAIKSALAQTVSQTEIVIVDDGSTDRTADIANSYPQTTYIYQHNQGSSAARNEGLRITTGEYVVFLDADDRLLPKAAEAGLQCFRKFPDSGFVFGRYEMVDADGMIISEPNSPPTEDDFYLALLQRNLIGMQSTVFYSRSILDRADGFDERLRSCEDYDLYLRITRQFPVHKHNEVVAQYRRHGKNMSRNYASMLKKTIQVLNAQLPYISRDPRYREALRMGISNWRTHYGGLMVQDLCHDFRIHGSDRISIKRLGTLAATYPQGIGFMAKKVLRGMIHR